MAWSFKKRIKIIPGVHLNISKSGISTTIGVKGASVNFGKSGVTLNTSIPGTGISWKEKLSDASETSNSNIIPESIPEESKPSPSDNIFSADIGEITSQGMQGIKEAILMAYKQRNELKKDLSKVKISLITSKVKLMASYVLVYGFFNKNNATKEDIKSQKEAIKQISEQVNESAVKLEVEFDAEIKVKYEHLVAKFQELAKCQKIWDITSAHSQNKAITRSLADTTVARREVKFGLSGIEDIQSTYQPLWLKNANGADLYIYPNFLIMYTSKTEFAIIGFDEIEFHQNQLKFVETSKVPSDSKVVGKTWAKVNKNGTPDKRFKDNYEIPLVEYGDISLQTKTGLNEQYQFSNLEATKAFGNAFKEYQSILRSLKKSN